MAEFTCSVCKKDFKPSSLKLVENQTYPKCDECHYAKKAQSSLANANRKKQSELMSLEKRMEKIEKTIGMMETLIEVACSEQIDKLFQQIDSVIDKETQKQIDKLQNQIIVLNNKIIQIQGFESRIGEIPSGE
jgi:uncharacterized protein YpiB (UPF0302 family)